MMGGEKRVRVSAQADGRVENPLDSDRGESKNLPQEDRDVQSRACLREGDALVDRIVWDFRVHIRSQTPRAVSRLVP